MPDISVSFPSHLNYLAVLVCGVVNFALGGLWYSPALFAAAWTKAAGLDPNRRNRSGMGAAFGGAAASGLVVALCLAYLLKVAHADTSKEALRLAWTAWIGFTAAASASDYLFQRRGWTLFAINNGLHFVTFTINALILAAWR